MHSKLLKGIIFLFLALCLTTNPLFANRQATTIDGRSVQLNDDGTWQYRNAEPLNTSQDFTFRKTRWGMTKDRVKLSEPTMVYREKIRSNGQEGIYYKSIVNNMNVLILYEFTQGKLAVASYMFRHTHSNKNDYITDYRTIKKTLTQKYNAPILDEEIWKNDLYKDDPQNWGIAISVGHHYQWSKWETPDTKILLGLKGDNSEVFLSAVYKSHRFAKMEKAATDQANMDAF